MDGVMTAAQLGGLIRETVPAWSIPAFIAITRLGNIGLLLVVFTIDYWFGDSRRGAHAIGLAIGGMAVVTALKAFFAVPRPPEPVNVIPITGFSFPSGHAVAATIGYGVLAYDLEIGSRPARYGVASVLIVLVALSRVVLGVHFVRDVVAGVAIGLVFLVAAIGVTGHRPRSGFVLALGLAAVAFAVSGASQDGVAVVGAATGATLAWEVEDTIPTVDSLQGRVLLLAGVLPVLGGVGVLSQTVEFSLVIVFVLNAVILGGILIAPVLIARYV